MLLFFLFLFATGDSLEIYTEPSCAPCQQLKAAVAADPSLLEGYDVTYLRAKDGRRKGVRVVPTLIKYRDGKEVDRVSGFGGPESLKRWLSK